MRKLTLAAAVATCLVVSIPASVRASDHADPIKLKHREAGLTGLFCFPDGDQMILILGARPALSAAPPYNLSPWEYTIYMDLHSKVSYDHPADLARYGGTVVDPTGIRPDVTLRFRLNDDTTIREKSLDGLADPDAVRVWSGVRDDPFIFPRFFGKNIIAIVLSIPMSSFPEGQQDWILWATTRDAESGKQIDHVGRSNRTQLGRFDFLNTVPPDEQVAAIRKTEKSRDRILGYLKKLSMPLASLYNAVFVIRNFDIVPDVMFYTTRFPPGFPNGRRLTDDVALQTCLTGDCLLYEASFADSEAWPRQTVNDKPFLDHFPYLAEPWPAKPEAPEEGGGCLPWVIGILVVLIVLVWFFLRRRRRKRARR